LHSLRGCGQLRPVAPRLWLPCPASGRARGRLVGGAGPSGLRCRQGELACLAGTRGQEAGRAKITDSREGAKPRSSEEKKDNFSPEPSGRAGGAVSRQRPSGATAVVRQAGPAARQALGGTGDRSGLGARRGWSQANETGNDGGPLLLLAENYNQTTNDLTTEAQRHRAHRGRTEDAQRLFSGGFVVVFGLPILAGRREQRPAACRACRLLCRGSRLTLLGPPPAGRAVRARLRCYQAGLFVWQALVPGGREAGRPVGPWGSPARAREPSPSESELI